MRNILFVISISMLCFCSCSDTEGVQGSSNIDPFVDPTILHTDTLGNVLGGDLTDWCYNGGNGFYFNPVYPNPVRTYFKQFYSIVFRDTINLFFLRTENDTLFIARNLPIEIGQMEIMVNATHLGLSGVKRFYVQTRRNYNPGSNCKYYGDVQFY